MSRNENDIHVINLCSSVTSLQCQYFEEMMMISAYYQYDWFDVYSGFHRVLLNPNPWCL